MMVIMVKLEVVIVMLIVALTMTVMVNEGNNGMTWNIIMRAIVVVMMLL